MGRDFCYYTGPRGDYHDLPRILGISSYNRVIPYEGTYTGTELLDQIITWSERAKELQTEKATYEAKLDADGRIYVCSCGEEEVEGKPEDCKNESDDGRCYWTRDRHRDYEDEIRDHVEAIRAYAEVYMETRGATVTIEFD